MPHTRGPMLQDKVAVVTGGSTGIGEAISKLFALEGAMVAVNGLPGDPVEEVVGEITRAGGQAVAAVGDVGAWGDAEGVMTRTVEAFGRIDIVIANAGYYPKESMLPDFELEEFEDVIHTNVRGVFNTVRAGLPHLRDTQGAIVATGSVAGLMGLPFAVSYGATKGWIHSFIRGVAIEQAKFGIRANVVQPGPIDTEMTRPTKGNITLKSALFAVKGTPLGRRGTPEEVAELFLFLASDRASYITASEFLVDGGIAANNGMLGIIAKSEASDTPEVTLDLEHQHEGRKDLAKPA